MLLSMVQVTPTELKQALTHAFGHLSNPGEMNDYSCKGGFNGLAGLFDDIISPVLDTIPTTSRHYFEIYRIIETLLGALAARLRTFMVSGTLTRSP